MAKLLKFLIFQRNSLKNYIRKENLWSICNFDRIIRSNNNKKCNNYTTNRTNKSESIDENHSHHQQQPQPYESNEKYINNRQHDTKRRCTNSNSEKNSKEDQHRSQQQQQQQHQPQPQNHQPQHHQQTQQKLTDGHKTQKRFCTVASMSNVASSSLLNYAHLRMTKLHLNKRSNIRKKSNSSITNKSWIRLYLTLLIALYCCVSVQTSSAETVHSSSDALWTEDDSTTNLSTNATFVFSKSPLNNSSNYSNTTFNLDLSAAANRMHQRLERGAANVPDEEDDSSYHDDEFDEYEALINNKSARGKYIGAPCDNNKCDSTLLHVLCDKETQLCGCERNFPVQLGLTKGCAKPKKLGEQCFYDETCIYSDENSLCIQVRHNARCQCASGFHSVSYAKPTRKVFCTQDLKELKSDLPTLLGVSSGIAVLAGLICMVLHLFSKTKYPRHRNFGDANLPPPIMYSSETGIPLAVQSARPSSRSSLRSSGSIGSYGNRRSSTHVQSSSGHVAGGGGGSAGSKGILVSTSRTGSRRPSLASVHSTSSSVRSYSMMRFEKESQQKEIRQEMKLRLARLQHQQHLQQNKPQIVIGDTLLHHHGPLARISIATPSPLTPNSLDELLPSVDETQELFPTKTEITTTTTNLSRNATPLKTLTTKTTTDAGVDVSTAANAAYNGPCSSSTEAL